MRKIALPRTLLFDGPETILPAARFELTVADRLIGFSVEEITALPLEDYAGPGYEKMILETVGIGTDTRGHYKSREGLELYCLEKNGHVLLFSFGELQPARYQLYVESAWQVFPSK